MAIYHCAIKIISRGKGMSAVGACAYRSGEVLQNEYDGIIHDFTRKRGIVYTEILLPSHAPPEFADRSTLWNSVERIEKSKNSQLAREIEVALPIELDREGQIRLVRGYVQENFVSAGMCADIAIHDKNDGNPHAHIMLTMRPLEQSGEWGGKSKKEYVLDKSGQRIKLKNGGFKSRKVDTVDWNDRGNAERWRKAWADCINRSLVEQDIQKRVDHRSYKRQGKEQIPTIHAGVSATQMERRGMRTERGEKNRRIRERNRLLKEVRRRIAGLGRWLKERTAQNGNQTVDLSDLPLFELQERLSKIKENYWSAKSKIKRMEKLIHEREELMEQAEKYLLYRDCHRQYMQCKFKEKEDFAERHRRELSLYGYAERYLKAHLGEDTKLKLQEWKSEISLLKKQKDSLYQKMYGLKREVAEVEVIKRRMQQKVKPIEQGKENAKDRSLTTIKDR